LIRIFDTFPFDAELDLLEHRLEETYDLIDAFVLVEAAETYSGHPKDLTFAAHRKRFAWASSKLRVVSLNSLGGAGRSPRERAAIQRNAIKLGLRDAAPEDAVLLFDADEIASPQFLARLRGQGIDEPRRVLMTRLYEHADAAAPRSPCCPSADVPFQTATPHLRPGQWPDLGADWHSASSVVVPYRALASRSAFSLRFEELDSEPIAGGGRHFSSVDPSTRLERKLNRVFHTEWAGDRQTSPCHLARCRRNGVHHRGWWYAERPAGPVPDDVQRLLDRLGSAPTVFPRRHRRRLVRAWAWLRLTRWIPDRLVLALDRHLDRVWPLLWLPLLAADLLHQAAGSTMSRCRSDIPRTNSATSWSHAVGSMS
jgi:beta-1,4-mannosyl-glycoprotein beta-1,4-N-acetylglucosaminyltransferase